MAEQKHDETEAKERAAFATVLREARSRIESAAATGREKKTLAGAVHEALAGIDRALAAVDRHEAAAAPLSTATPSLSPDHDIEALRREVERLRLVASHDHGLLDAVLNHSPHGILICDATGRLVLQNRAAERIWAGSATAADVEGWGQYRAFHPDGRAFEASDWSMARCLTQGTTVEAEEVHFQRFDGSHGMLLGSCAPFRGEAGEITGAVSVFADITHFKQIEQLKDRWVAVAGHEMRTPLSVLRTRVELARRSLDRGDTLDLGRLFGILENQVNRLNAMVEDMLDASRAEAGTLTVDKGAVPIRMSVQHAVEPLVAASAKHSLELAVDDVTAAADAMRVEQVLSNLVGNAIRYSPAGGRIVVRAKSEGGEVVVEVEDQGLGFEPEAAQRLFEPFFQRQRSGLRGGGLGLGLYLARELVSRMGGRIWARSDGKDRGATFTFTLPVYSAA